jgi:hypothetical protein
VGSKALAEIKVSLDKILEQYKVVEVPAEPGEVAPEVETQPADTAADAEAVVAQPVTEIPPEAEATQGAQPVTALEATPVVDTVTAEPVAEPAVAEAPAPDAVADAGETPAAEPTEQRTPEQEFLDAMGQTDEDGAGSSPAAKAAKKKDKDKDKGKKAGRDRVLVFDEELGRTVVQRSRKPGRASEFLDDIEMDEE